MAKQKILIIEDDKVISASIQALLEANDYQVTICDEGISGIRHAQTQPPDLPLLDLRKHRLGHPRHLRKLLQGELSRHP